MDVRTWQEFPYPVLNKIFSFLPTIDIVNAGKVCVGWNLTASRVLEHIRIDDGTAYGGSFLEYNKRMPGDGNEKAFGRSMKLLQFVKDLTRCTDSIKYVDIDVEYMSAEGLKMLLMSQKAIKSLVIEIRSDLSYDSCFFDKVDPLPDHSCIRDELIKGIIKHESSLEKLNIGIDGGYFITFKDLKKGFEHKESCFDNLKSVEFLSTSAGVNFCFSGVGEYHPSEEEKQSAIEMFSKMFRNAKIEELNFRQKLSLSSIHTDPNVYWSPVFVKMLMKYFNLGAFSNLKKINADSLNTGGLYWDFSMAEADLLIKHCPSLTHIDFNEYSLDINEYHSPEYDEKSFIKLVEHYGSQLVCFNPPVMTSNIAKCICENCPNLRSIKIDSRHEYDLKHEDLLSVGDLSYLKNVTLLIHCIHRSPDPAIKFLEKVIGKLKKLTIALDGSEFAYNMMGVISQYGHNLRELDFYSGPTLNDTELNRILNAFHDILQNCDQLERLLFSTYASYYVRGRFSWENVAANFHLIVEALISKQKYLRFAYLNCPHQLLTDECKEKIVDGMPFCRIEFESR